MESETVLDVGVGGSFCGLGASRGSPEGADGAGEGREAALTSTTGMSEWAQQCLCGGDGGHWLGEAVSRPAYLSVRFPLWRGREQQAGGSH